MQFKVTDFDFDFPQDLIAQYPCATRSGSRLLHLNKNTGAIEHLQFNNFPSLLNTNDLLIFNDTKVIPARIFGKKETGGKVEILVERIVSSHKVTAHIKASKSPYVGSEIVLNNGLKVRVFAKEGDLFKLHFNSEQSILKILQEIGEVPLPPYIKRKVQDLDQDRYQTIFAKYPGAVAAPTAALHFDEKIINNIKARGIDIAFITLHVGAGTFQPIRTEAIKEHKMHAEYIDVAQEVCEKIIATKNKGGRVIAVGTTAVRALETASASGIIKPYQGDTDIFIYPSFKFNCVDALLTNFHLPKSTLLMLVSALAGSENIKYAYKEAIAKCYRFFSYGDAMFIAG